MTGQEYRNIINRIRSDMLNGIISYDEAKEQAKPYISDMNDKAKEIAKKYNMRFKKFTFSELMR